MKNVKRLEKRLDQFVEVSVPERFEKRDGEIYGLLHGEWRLYSLRELTNLKNKIKERREQKTKRNEPVDIEVILFDKDKDNEPETLHDFGDGWILGESGIDYCIVIGIEKV